MIRYILFIFLFSLILASVLYLIFYKKRWSLWKKTEEVKLEDKLQEIKTKQDLKNKLEEMQNEIKKRK